MDDALYKRWRETKLENYPVSAEDLCVEIGGLNDMSAAEKAAIIANCTRFNMCIYRCRDASADRASVRAFAAGFGLGIPVEQGLDVGAGDGLAVFEAQQVFEQHFQGIGQPLYLVTERGKTVDLIPAVTDLEAATG